MGKLNGLLSGSAAALVGVVVLTRSAKEKPLPEFPNIDGGFVVTLSLTGFGGAAACGVGIDVGSAGNLKENVEADDDFDSVVPNVLMTGFEVVICAMGFASIGFSITKLKNNKFKQIVLVYNGAVRKVLAIHLGEPLRMRRASQ